MSEAASELNESASKITESKSKYSKVKVKHPFEEVFQGQSYTIDQPFFQIFTEGYTIKSACGNEVYNAERKRMWFRQYFAKIAPAFIIAIMFTGIFASNRQIDPSSKPFLIIILTLLGIGLYIFLVKFLSPKRRTTLYQGLGNEKALFTIEPSSGIFFFTREYRLKDYRGKSIMIFKRPFLQSLLRIRWNAYSRSGKYMYTAIEDSLLKAILRRYFKLAYFIPMQFHLNKGGGKEFAQFKRRFTIRDKYNLEHNPKAAPSWIIIATAILLDTGEER